MCPPFTLFFSDFFWLTNVLSEGSILVEVGGGFLIASVKFRVHFLLSVERSSCDSSDVASTSKNPLCF